jgi:hypothetical protein
MNREPPRPFAKKLGSVNASARTTQMKLTKSAVTASDTHADRAIAALLQQGFTVQELLTALRKRLPRKAASGAVLEAAPTQRGKGTILLSKKRRTS